MAEIGKTIDSGASLSGPPNTQRMMIVCAIVALLAILAFLPTLHHGFVYDDWSVVVRHPSVNVRSFAEKARPWYRIWGESYWPSAPDKLYRPLTVFSWRLNAWLGPYPLKAEPFRIVNLVLHALTSVGVAVLMRRLIGRVMVGLLAGALFAVHPVHTEAVVTIYGRSELLVALFSVWLLARHVQPPAPGGPGLPRILSNCLLLAGAIFSKEHAVFVWPVLIAIDLCHRRNPHLASSRLTLREWFNTTFAPMHIGFAVVVVTFFLLRFSVFGWLTMAPARARIWEVPMAHVGLIEHLLTPFRLLWVMVTNLVWPDSLCPIWSYPALRPAETLYGDVLAGMAVAAALIGATVILWRKRSLAGAMCIGLVLSLLLPTQAIPFARWFYAERWLYLPTVFVAVLVGWSAHRAGRAAVLGGLACAVVLLPPVWQYGSKFASDYTLAREVILRQPDNYQGHRQLTAVYCWDERHSEAVQAANQMLQRFGPVSDAYLALCRSYIGLRDGRRAMDAIERYHELTVDVIGEFLTQEHRQALELIAQASRPAPSIK